MSMTEFPVAAPRRRRWLTHLIWFAIAVLALCGGVMLGFRIHNATFGMMLLDNKRNDMLGEIRVALRLISDDDINVHRRSEAMLLRTSLIELSVMPRYIPCRPRDAEGLIAARAYISTHPIESEQKFGGVSRDVTQEEIYAKGLSFCDKPATPYPYPHLLF
jgi:hypothetical protein